MKLQKVKRNWLVVRFKAIFRVIVIGKDMRVPEGGGLLNGLLPEIDMLF